MDTFDVLNPDVYGKGDPARNGLPLDDYARMRETAPCYRQQMDPLLLPWTWVLTRYDVVAVDRDHRRFSSRLGVTLRIRADARRARRQAGDDHHGRR